MAFVPSIDFQRPSSQLSIDRKPVFLDEFNDDESSYMESTMMSPTTTTDDRRDSFGNSAGPVFSPQNAIWEDFSATPAMPDQHFAASRNPFVEAHSNNPFHRMDSGSFPQQSSWPMFDADTRVPVVPATYEPFNSEYEASAPGFSHGAPFGTVPQNVRPASVFPQASTPALSVSPPPPKDYMGFADQAHHSSRGMPKHMRPDSPSHYASSYQRGDSGIRKKNARFNIPQERNLANIDRLIGESQDDTEIKELKQQKRLLRNRQAALDSRQRKKVRAEELEGENNILKGDMAALAEELQSMKILAETTTNEKNELLQENQQFQQQVQEMIWDKENALTAHVDETSDLRRKIQVLQDRLVEVESSDSTRPNSADYEFTNEMSGLNVHGLGMEEWGDPLGDPFAEFMDSDVLQSTSKPMELVLAPKKKEVQEDEDEKSGAPGLLMLLLLCGAWVASKSKASMPVDIPRMPEEIRSDAALVFDDLMKDHGVSTFQSTGVSSGAQPIASGNSNIKQLAFAMPGSTNSRLGNIHSQLTRTTKDQEAASAFSLSVKQYDSLTSPDFVRPGYNTPPEDDSAASPGHRRNLVDTLKAMRDDSKGPAAANVYRRSVLWDHVPDEVLQQFKRMAEQTSPEGDSGGGT